MALDSEIILNLPDTERMTRTAAEPALRGSVLVLIQFDVCEEIRLDELRKIFAPAPWSSPASSTRLRDTFAINGPRWLSPSNR